VTVTHLSHGTFILLLLKFISHCHVLAVTVLGTSSYTLYAFSKNGDSVGWYSYLASLHCQVRVQKHLLS